MPKAITILLFTLACSAAWSQVTTRPATTLAGQSGLSRTPQMVIELKSFLPKEEFVIQIKTDTYVPAGKYPFTISKEVIRKESRKQLADWQIELNKWLEESK